MSIFKYKIDKRVALGTIIFLVFLGGLIYWGSLQAKNELREFGIKRSGPEYVADGIFNFLSKSFTGKETEKVKELEEKKIEAKNLQHKLVPLAKNKEELKEDITKEPVRENKGDKILVENKEYDIVYVTTPDVFISTIYSTDILAAKVSIENWFKEKGFTSEDLCGIGLHFVPDVSIRGAVDLTKFDSRASGCD